MTFKKAIENHVIDEAKAITISSFLDALSKYTSLDKALEELPVEYLVFYSDNESKLNKAISKLFEDYNTDANVDIGQGRQNKAKTIKKIKYKGELFILMFDQEIGNWVAIPGFRSITQALKYGKAQIDDVKEISKTNRV